MDDEFLQAVVALDPLGVLRSLAGADAGAGRVAPVVALFLSGGQVLEGAVVRLGDEHGREVAVLADGTSGRLTYVAARSVVAVQVSDPLPFRDVLTGGRLPAPYVGEPVTRLALRRRFAPSAEFPVQVDWDLVDGSDRMVGNLARLLTALREAVECVRIDEMGRQAWQQVPALRVEHRVGVSLCAQRQGDGLSVHADLLAALPRELTETLHQKINTLL